MRIGTKLGIALILFTLCFGTPGCVVTTDGEATWGIKWGSQLEVTTRAHPNPQQNKAEVRVSSTVVDKVIEGQE